MLLMLPNYICLDLLIFVESNPKMDVDALNIKDVLMSTETSEEDKITVLVQILECMDEGVAFPQLITDTLIAVSGFKSFLCV